MPVLRAADRRHNVDALVVTQTPEGVPRLGFFQPLVFCFPDVCLRHNLYVSGLWGLRKYRHGMSANRAGAGLPGPEQKPRPGWPSYVTRPPTEALSIAYWIEMRPWV